MKSFFRRALIVVGTASAVAFAGAGTASADRLVYSYEGNSASIWDWCLEDAYDVTTSPWLHAYCVAPRPGYAELWVRNVIPGTGSALPD